MDEWMDKIICFKQERLRGNDGEYIMNCDLNRETKFSTTPVQRLCSTLVELLL